MRLAVLLAALALSTSALADEPVKAETAKKARATIVLDPIEIKDPDGPPAALVITRSKHVKSDVDSTGDHLMDAAERR